MKPISVKNKCDNFHYREALNHFESFVAEMAKFQTEHREEEENA